MKMKKRRKLYHFKNLVADGIECCDYHNVTSPTGQKGIRYMLSKPLTSEQKRKLNNYDNVVISYACYKYAPQIKYDTLILLK